MLRAIVCAALILGLAACSAPPAEEALAQLPNVSFPAPNRIAAGALAADDVSTLAQAGVREVIDLRAPDETPDFDEGAALAKAGIAYRNLPIAGAADLTQDKVRRFDELLDAAGDQRTLVHCASSNRVGAMIALRAALVEGATADAALAEGRRWGLRGLEPAVRTRLAEWSATPEPAAAATR